MGKLILLRHGQSQWNLENRFTGWEDVPLTKEGILEAKKAGQLMKKNNISIDIIFSSVLKRANETARLAITEMNLIKFWRNKELVFTRDKSLNERDYGNLVGLNKKETAQKYGKEQVHIWRRSYDVPPPGGESLKDVVNRVKPYYEKNIKIKTNDKDILIVAHGNSLRAIMVIIGLYQPKDISNIELPTGSPFIVSFKENKIINFKFLK